MAHSAISVDPIAEREVDLLIAGAGPAGMAAALIASLEGLDVLLCEKPFLASVPQCQQVKKLADETGVKIIVAHVRRYRPAFIRARELFNGHTDTADRPNFRRPFWRLTCAR